MKTSTAPNRVPLTLARAADALVSIDARVAGALRPATLPALRVLLGLLFVWFGSLKLIGASPVKEIVAGTLPFLDPDLSVTSLGGVEVLLGLGLVTGTAVRLVLPLLVAHLAGTFLTFGMVPELMFRSHNPLLLTESGEFVTKNLVLICAALILVSHTPTQSTRSVGTLDVVREQAA